MFRVPAMLALSLVMTGCGSSDDNSTAPATSPTADASLAFCYETAKPTMRDTIDHSQVGHDVLVLIDQTTTFPAELKAQVKKQISNLLKPGTRVNIGVFSTYSSSAFAANAFETRIEPSYPEGKRGSAPMAGLRELDRCLASRLASQTSSLDAALSEALDANRKDIKFSDVMVSVREFSKRFENATVPTTMVIISDMLENSTAASFYANGKLRQIDPAAELKKAAAQDMLPSLPKSKVFLLGVGLIPDDAKEKYRSVQQVEALEKFWQEYFRSAGAASVSVGKPMLVGETIS